MQSLGFCFALRKYVQFLFLPSNCKKRWNIWHSLPLKVIWPISVSQISFLVFAIQKVQNELQNNVLQIDEKTINLQRNCLCSCTSSLLCNFFLTLCKTRIPPKITFLFLMSHKSSFSSISSAMWILFWEKFDFNFNFSILLPALRNWESCTHYLSKNTLLTLFSLK